MGKLSIDLQTFKVVQKDDLLGKDEPYLWCIGIMIDLHGSGTPDLPFIIKKNPRPGNLGDKFKKGESRAIPSAIGRIEHDLIPIFGTLLAAGIVVVAWDHDKTPA